jgi:creatinine amidohydrolase
VIFPPYYFTQIHEAKHQAGTIAIPFRMMFDLLEAACDEIARNGMNRIVLLNGHGGNNHFLPYFAQSMLEKPRGYTVYVIGLNAYLPEGDPKWQSMRQTQVDGHAGEEETSIMLALHPELCRLDQITESGMPQKRSKHLGGLYNSIGWYAEFPNHYAGDGRVGTREKGQYIVDLAVKRIAELLKIAKSEPQCPRLIGEFHQRAESMRKG